MPILDFFNKLDYACTRNVKIKNKNWMAQWNSRLNQSLSAVYIMKGIIGAMYETSVNSEDVTAFFPSLLPPQFILSVKHERLSWIINFDLFHNTHHCLYFSVQFKTCCEEYYMDYRCHYWEDTLHSSPCHCTVSVQEMSVHFILKAGFLHLSQFPEPFGMDTNVRYCRQKQLGDVFVGLQCCRTSYFLVRSVGLALLLLLFGWCFADSAFFTCRNLLLWVAERQEERLYRPTSVHAEQPWHSPVQRTIQNKNEGKYVLDLLVQQRAFPFSD